jgi:EAL domain-containing protein (putative c-di-GMP-specific phosphodiesterase class I)
VRLSIDDFGSGYSSLAQLRRLPVREIKLDRSFLADLGDEKSRALLAFLLRLGVALGVEVVAEGVESRELWEWLATMGCELAQGYYLLRPQPPEQLEAWLREGPLAPR